MSSNQTLPGPHMQPGTAADPPAWLVYIVGMSLLWLFVIFGYAWLKGYRARKKAEKDTEERWINEL